MAPSTKASRPGSNATTPSDSSMTDVNTRANGHQATHEDDSIMVSAPTSYLSAIWGLPQKRAAWCFTAKVNFTDEFSVVHLQETPDYSVSLFTC